MRYLHYSTQLRDFARFAARKGLRFDLYIRRSTTLSEELKAAQRAGLINIRFIPGT